MMRSPRTCRSLLDFLRWTAARRLGVLAAASLIAGGIFFASAEARPADDAPAARSVTAAEFSTEIAQIEARVRALENDPGGAQVLARALPSRWIVGERQAAVSADGVRALARRLTEQPSRRRELQAALAAQLAELSELASALSASPAGVPSAKANDSRVRLSQILGRSEFTSAMRGSAFELWKARALHWLIDQLQSFFSIVPLHGAAGRAFLWGVIALLVAMLALWLYRHFRDHGLALMELGPAPPRALTWGHWFRTGMELAQAGRFRDAVHALYWAAVYRLEELHVWSLDRARTPREYLRLMATRAGAPELRTAAPLITPEQRRALELLTTCYELTWYGYRRAGSEEFQAAVAHLEVLGCRSL